VPRIAIVRHWPDWVNQLGMAENPIGKRAPIGNTDCPIGYGLYPLARAPGRGGGTYRQSWVYEAKPSFWEGWQPPEGSLRFFQNVLNVRMLNVKATYAV